MSGAGRVLKSNDASTDAAAALSGSSFCRFADSSAEGASAEGGRLREASAAAALRALSSIDAFSRRAACTESASLICCTKGAPCDVLKDIRRQQLKR